LIWKFWAKTFTDHIGTKHSQANSSARIISLVPSLTELLIDLGLADQIVGRTKYCIHPADAVNNVPIIGGTKSIDDELIMTSGATHVVVNVDETPKLLADKLNVSGLKVIVTHPNSPLDNPALFRLLGGIFDKADKAEDLCHLFTQKMATLQRSAQELPPLKVLYLIWRKPWMTISEDTYISNTLRLVNWQAVGGSNSDRYPDLDLEETLKSEIDMVLFSSEPYPFTTDHIETFHQQFPDYVGKAAIIDAEMVSWYGSRAIPGLTYLGDYARKFAS
jgi:ABC-type Fe3+-hydroxamate transport system substrate-binding protein